MSNLTPEASWNLGILNAKFEMDALLGSFQNQGNQNTVAQHYANEIHYANQVIMERNAEIAIKEQMLIQRDAKIATLQAKLDAACSIADLDHKLMYGQVLNEKLEAINIKKQLLDTKDELHDRKFSSYRYGIDYDALKLAVQQEYGHEAAEALVAKQRELAPDVASKITAEDYPTHEDRYPELYGNNNKDASCIDNNDEAMKAFLLMKEQILNKKSSNTGNLNDSSDLSASPSVTRIMESDIVKTTENEATIEQSPEIKAVMDDLLYTVTIGLQR